jgi:myo-inositol-1-phosphate synthase
MQYICNKDIMKNNETLGIWFAGARGSIATAAMVGCGFLAEKLIEPNGILTNSSPFSNLDFIDWAKICFGGIDPKEDLNLSRVDNLLDEGVLPWRRAKEAKEIVGRWEQFIEPLPIKKKFPSILRELEHAITRFRDLSGADKIIVVDVSSTEPIFQFEDMLFACKSIDEIFSILEKNNNIIPWSILYALAACKVGAAHINFTPNIGADLPLIDNLMKTNHLPYTGKDGKTGETLLKTVLAPMFAARSLPVLAWQGYNMLGNSDGHTLADPARLNRKLKTKGQALTALLLAEANQHIGVNIDYVPSLGDWKTAWNFIHFRGFLGAKMSLQFTWSGCDTALAVPLVLDLIRWVERGARFGEYGALNYLESYFKSPIGSSEQDFRRQIDKLYLYYKNSKLKQIL